MKRREFLKLSAAGVATLLVGSRLPGLGITNAYAAGDEVEIFITDARKQMVTHNSLNEATCYFWIYKVKANGTTIPVDIVDCPGPTIVALKGDTVNLRIKNELDRDHSFCIPGMYDSGPIAPGQTVTGSFIASVSGAHLYYDNLNEPVNRMMGLHGALLVRPTAPAPGHKFTPYDNPTPHVQALFDSFGGTAHFPGLGWQDGDPATLTPAFRQYAWVLHQASPNLFDEVGNFAAPYPAVYPAAQFVQKFLRDGFSPTRNNNIPQYFTINGQSGFFSHFSPTITPMGRVGEPAVVHMINAGLWTHSMHFHCNHFYVTYENGVSPNPLWVDVFNINPMDRVDYTLPFMRPPNIPNIRGLGLPDAPATTVNGNPCYPPAEEMNVYMPELDTVFAEDINGDPVDLAQRMSPLCYPMHDHCEPSQTSQGGNYNCGLISGMYLVGDRNIDPNGVVDFPMDHDFEMMYRNIRGVSGSVGVVPAPGTEPEHMPE